MRLDLCIKKNLGLFLDNSTLGKKNKREFVKLPRSFWQKEINLGNIKIENNIVKPSINIDVSKILSIKFDWKKIKNNWKSFHEKILIPTPIKIEFLKITSNLLVVNKPAGLPVYPSFPLKRELGRTSTLIEGVACEFPDVLTAFEEGEEERPGIVHRLDKKTSGVLLIARNLETKHSLKKQFKGHRTEKSYLALVEGVFPLDTFRLTGMVGKRANNPMKMGVTGLTVEPNYKFSLQKNRPAEIINPKRAVTFGEKIANGTLKELSSFNYESPIHKKIFLQWKKLLSKSQEANKEAKFSLLKIDLVTGRTHQIRLHLSSLGFPVVGDSLYGNPASPLPFYCLHAYQISWFNSRNIQQSAATDKVILF